MAGIDISPAADAPPEAVDTLLFDAYKALLVLHRMMDSAGLTAGVDAAEQIADRIVSANPDFPPRTALRSPAVATEADQPTPAFRASRAAAAKGGAQ